VINQPAETLLDFIGKHIKSQKRTSSIRIDSSGNDCNHIDNPTPFASGVNYLHIGLLKIKLPKIFNAAIFNSNLFTYLRLV